MDDQPTSTERATITAEGATTDDDERETQREIWKNRWLPIDMERGLPTVRGRLTVRIDGCPDGQTNGAQLPPIARSPLGQDGFHSLED
ncbi:hypothetical protein Mapa_004849 [Marchantia paleacea]|nr:hypothetical protein Mapa_004849 [Marchantia paleacea]